jgi:hypothetical protein
MVAYKSTAVTADLHKDLMAAKSDSESEHGLYRKSVGSLLYGAIIQDETFHLP